MDPVNSSTEQRCPTCHGNARDIPCAYPSEDMPGCLRTANALTPTEWLALQPPAVRSLEQQKKFEAWAREHGYSLRKHKGYDLWYESYEEADTEGAAVGWLAQADLLDAVIEEHAALRVALREAYAVLWPAPCPQCDGCEYEWKEAVRILGAAIAREDKG